MDNRTLMVVALVAIALLVAWVLFAPISPTTTTDQPAPAPTAPAPAP